MLNNLGFFQKITLGFVVLIGLISICTALIVGWNQDQALERLILQNAKVITRAIATGARDPILTNNFELLPALLKRGVESVDVEYAYILDREGICLAHTDPSRVGTRFFLKSVSTWRKEFEAGKAENSKFIIPQRERENIIEVIYPIKISTIKRFYGVVNVGLKEDFINAAREDLQALLLGIFITAFIFGFAAISVLAIQATQPLQDMVTLARQITHGNFQIPDNKHSFMEEKMLKESLSEMAFTIQSNINNLKESNTSLDRKVYELQTLMDAALKMNSKCYSNEVLEYMMDQAVYALDASWGSLLLADVKEKGLVPRIVRGKQVEVRGTVRIQLGEGIAGRVYSTQEPYISNKGFEDPLFKPKDSDSETRIFNLLCVPLLIENQAIGVINVLNKKTGDFDQNDQNLLVSLASLVARSIENSQLYNMAITDGLTEVFIKKYFEDRLIDMVQQSLRYSLTFSIIYADIDNFKSVNDHYGHVQGDSVIRMAAKIMLEEARDNIDMVARIGGEEFAILLPETSKDGAFSLANRIRELAETKLDSMSGLPRKVTMSFGVATFPDDAKSSQELIEKADGALYKSKQTGRNRVSLA
ncbi:MAG: diguanylate cyclase [bacterium]|nr:diguanylate cyclase [bacterium]